MASHLFQNPENPNEIIRGTSWGDIPAWKASTLATGSMGAYSEYMKSVRADALDAEHAIAKARDAEEELNEREANLLARERALEDGTLKLRHMIDRAAAMIEDLESARRADQEPLPLPPTEEPEELTEDPPPSEDPEIAEDEGDLEPLKAKGEEPNDAATGAFPNELDLTAPPATGNYPTLEQPEPPQVPQPPAISLNAEDN
jgi:hypothetical protein